MAVPEGLLGWLMRFGRGELVAEGARHRHAGHGEAVARISWCVDQRAIGVITGEVEPGSHY